MLFSYGSGLCSSMLTIKIRSNPLNKNQITNITDKLTNRVKFSPEDYTRLMLQKQKNYGVFRGQIKMDEKLLDDNVYYLSQIDEKWRRKYLIKNQSPIDINKKSISSMLRLQNLNKTISADSSFSKFYKLSVGERLDIVNQKFNN